METIISGILCIFIHYSVPKGMSVISNSSSNASTLVSHQQPKSYFPFVFTISVLNVFVIFSYQAKCLSSKICVSYNVVTNNNIYVFSVLCGRSRCYWPLGAPLPNVVNSVLGCTLMCSKRLCLKIICAKSKDSMKLLAYTHSSPWQQDRMTLANIQNDKVNN